MRPISWVFTVLLAGCSMTDPVHDMQYVEQQESQLLSLRLVSGDAQSAFAGHAPSEPLVVRAVDENETAFPDKEITFEVMEGEASILGGETVSTNAEGLASSRIQLGATPGQIKIRATLNAPRLDETLHQVIFTTTCLAPGDPKLLILNDQANGQRGTAGQNLPVPLGVVAIDGNGDPVPGQEIRFTITKGSSGVQIVPSATTDENGTASAVLSLGTAAEEIDVTATWTPADSKNGDVSVMFHETAEPDSPASLKFVSGHVDGSDRVCAAEQTSCAAPIVLQLTDQYGNPIEGVAVRVDPDGNSAVDGLPLDQLKIFTTDGNGNIQFGLTAGSAPENDYNTTTTVDASTLPFGPSAQATFNITKAKWMSFDDDTKIFNYGYTGCANLICLALGYVFHVGVFTQYECWKPIVGVTVNVTYSYVMDQCPAFNLNWSAEGSYFQMVTDASGKAVAKVNVPIAFVAPPHPIAAGRLTFTAPGMNSLQLYAGPPDCE